MQKRCMHTSKHMSSTVTLRVLGLVIHGIFLALPLILHRLHTCFAVVDEAQLLVGLLGKRLRFLTLPWQTILPAVRGDILVRLVDGSSLLNRERRRRAVLVVLHQSPGYDR